MLGKQRLPPLPAWLQAFENAQSYAMQAARRMSEAAEPTTDLRPAASAVARCLGSIYGAMDQRHDRLSDIRDAASALLETIAALEEPRSHDPVLGEAHDLLESARDALASAEKHFASRPAEPPPLARELQASRKEVSLHWVTRASLTPIIKVPAPPPPPPLALAPLDKPSNVAELAGVIQQVRERAEQRTRAREERAKEREEATASAQPRDEKIPEGFVAPIDPALSEYEFVRARTRDYFEELAMVGSQRQPQLGDSWRSIAFLEQRMFAAIDAIASLGPVALHTVEQLVLDSPVKDPSRGFAAAVLFGSVEGRDSLAAAERIIRFLDARDPEVSQYAVDALKLVPHPSLPLAMRTLLRDSEPAYRALGLEVLASRDMVSIEELATGARDAAPAVVGVALTELAKAQPNHPELAGMLLPALENPELAPTCWLAMTLSHHPQALSAPVRALDGPERSQAALALALAADAQAAAKLLALSNEHADPGLATALGWAGSPEAVPHLIALLARGEEEIASAAAYALDRITGAQLYEEVEIDPEEIIIPDAPVPQLDDDEQRLARQLSDPRDQPGSGSPDTITRPSTDPKLWQAYWSERQDGYQRDARYRRGHAYTPLVSWWELGGWILTAPERQLLQHELIVRTGHFIRFDPLALVSVQEQALEEWEPIAKAASGSPGSWSRPQRRA